MEMLDTFLWIIDNEQFKLKWDAKIWPYDIELKIRETLENLEIEFEKFEKIQFEDELSLQDKVEYISGAILKLTIETNLSKVFEISVDINRNWKFIKELQSFSQTLNLRQKLFGHPVSKLYIKSLPIYMIYSLINKVTNYNNIILYINIIIIGNTF